MDIYRIYWYLTILLSELLNIHLGFATEDAQIEEPKELLRHQQHHRPLFIGRRSTSILDINQSASKQSLSNAERHMSEQQLVEGKLNGEGNFHEMETSIETPLIRHGRSRGHFGWSKKVEEIEVIPKHSLMTSIGDSYEHPVATDDNEMVVNLGNRNDGNNDIEFEYFKSTGSITNSTMYLDMDFDDLTVANLTSNTSQENRQSSKFGNVVSNKSGTRHSGDSLRKLYKVKANRRTMFRGLATEPSDNSSRYDDIYGIIVHTANNGRSLDNVVDKNALEDYGGYDGYDDRQMNNWTNDYHFDNDNEENNFNEDFLAIDVIRKPDRQSVQVDIVTRFLRIIENQHLLGENCTAGTDLNLGEGVVDQYAQERFRLEANFAVNRANMLTRLWKYAPEVMLSSEYLLHASVLSMVEFDEDIFAAGNCYDKMQYRDHWLYCPFAHRLPDDDGILVKDLAIEYKYLSNSSEWFYIARKNAERVIANNNQFSHGYHSYTANESTHSDRIEDEILTVRYEDGRWSKPYYDCGGGNIWMLTYTVPFFGYINDTYYFKGTSGIDIDLRRVDIDQCPLPLGSTQLNIFAASDKCKQRTTECIAIPGLGFRRGSYRCVCKRGFYYPDTKSLERYYNGTVIEEEYEKLMLGELSQYAVDGVFECLPCAEGCEYCENGSPCLVSLNWLMRTAILILECCVIACLPVVILFTWKYGNVKVVKAASPVLLRVIVLGAFCIYCTTIVMYPRPNVVTCTIRVWLREIGFSLTYGALMLKTWRNFTDDKYREISVIFRVKSAKAVKITDMNLLKRLGIIVTVFSVFLGIRTIVAPPIVIVGRTADDLKAYLCRTDWWDHSFTSLEVMFLVWGIRLCIVVRKAPSEFNESRFISVAIYNEFLLTVFLNVSMLFLQSPANPDLLYIIFFCHTQLTVTLLLGLIFGSKAYVVFRGGGKEDAMSKLPGTTGKFIGKSCRAQGASNQTNSISLQQANFTEEGDGVTEEFRRFYTQLELLKEKNLRMGNRHLAAKLLAMQVAANQSDTQISAVQEIASTLRFNRYGSLTIEESAVVDVEPGKLNVNAYLKVCDKSSNKMVKSVQLSIEDGNKKHSASSNTMENINGETSSEQFSSRPLEPNADTIRTKPVSTIESDNVNIEAVTLPISSPSCSNTVGNASENNDVSNAETKKKELKEGEVHKSGHARTHAIVINLDDKTRFSEEVTV